MSWRFGINPNASPNSSQMNPDELLNLLTKEKNLEVVAGVQMYTLVHHRHLDNADILHRLDPLPLRLRQSLDFGFSELPTDGVSALRTRCGLFGIGLLEI